MTGDCPKCKSDSTSIKMCAVHKAEWQALHDQAQIDYRRTSKLFDESCEASALLKAQNTPPASTPETVTALVKGDLTEIMTA